MCFFHFIKQDNRIWFSSNRLGELTTFIIADIARRRTDQSCHTVLLHILTHINTNHIGFVVKQGCRQRLCKFRFTDTGRAEEQEGTNRFCRVLDTRFGTNDGIAHKRHRIVLTDNTFMQFLIQMQCLVSLTLRQLCNRDPGPLGDNLCDFLICHTFMHKTSVLRTHLCLQSLQLLFYLWQSAILQLCSFFQIIIPLRNLNLIIHILQFLPQLPDTLHILLLVLPDSLHLF